MSKPVIFIAFANDKVDYTRYLRNLPIEHNGLRDAILDAQQAGLCELVERANVTIDQMLDVFQRYQDRIAVFHYGGHADGYQLMLEAADGTHAVAHGGGLVGFFARQKGLKLVFFNGCSTQQQTLELIEAGVPAVVGTSNSINDDIATALSIRFYKGLSTGTTIQRAWDEALDNIKIQYGTETKGMYRLKRGETAPDLFPWTLYVREGNEIVKDWNLPEAVDNPLFGLPDIPRMDLPEQPYRFLERYKREHAPIFFGRSYYVRDLYNRTTDKNSAPIILLYGQSGVGKSSMLDAGLLPRLEQIYNIIYVRRDAKLGLLGTFKKALGIDENAEKTEEEQKIQQAADLHFQKIDNQIRLLEQAIRESSGEIREELRTSLEKLKEMSQQPYQDQEDSVEDQNNLRQVWKSQEKDLPFVIILDQVEECYTRANPAFKDELGEFLDGIQPIFLDVNSRPKGKLILSYRKEYHPEIKDAFQKYGLPREEIFLKALERKDIVEIIRGLTLTENLRRKYQLSIDENLPSALTDDLMADKDSPIAPVLQILLTKMWKMTENETLRTFSLEKYNTLKKQGILMDDFFKEQMQVIKNSYPELEGSGLALDILFYHTTKLGTATARNLEDLRQRYQVSVEKVEELIQNFKDLYILTDAGYNSSGLAHDTLAPIVQNEFRHSDKAGQRASIILENKLLAFEQDPENTFIDVEDLRIVEKGAQGMKIWTVKEKELVDKSIERKIRLEKERKRNQRIKQVGTLIIALLCIVAGFEWLEAERKGEIAIKNAKIAEQEKQIAQEQKHKAVLSAKEAQIAKDSADLAKIEALKQKDIALTKEQQAQLAKALAEVKQKEADSSAKVARKNEVLATTARTQAVQQKEIANKLRIISKAKELAIKSSLIQQASELKAFLALQAYIYNDSMGGNQYDADIQKALHDALQKFDNKISVKKKALKINLPSLKNNAEIYSMVYFGESHIITGDGNYQIKKWSIKDSLAAPVLLGTHRSIIRSLINLKNKWLVVGTEDKHVYVYDLENTGNQRQLFGQQNGKIWDIDISKKHKEIVVVSSDQNITTYQIEDATQKQQADKFASQYKHTIRVKSVAAAHKGSSVFFGDEAGDIWIWDLENPKNAPILFYDGNHGSPILTLAINQKDQFLAFGDGVGNLKVVDITSSELILQSRMHKSLISQVDFIKDGRLISSGFDGMIAIWDITQPKNKPCLIEDRSDWIRTFAISPKEEQIALGLASHLVSFYPINSHDIARELLKLVEPSISKDDWELYIGKDIAPNQKISSKQIKK